MQIELGASSEEVWKCRLENDSLRELSCVCFIRYPEEKSKDFSKKKKYSRILTDDKNVDRTFSRNTKMSTGHLVENQNIDRNNIEGSKI